MKWIIDAGHGGMLWDVYLTKGKRSPGKVSRSDAGVFEGEFNRYIANRLRVRDCRVLTSACDTSVRERVRCVNMAAKAYEDIALVSIHANAARGNKWSDAKGFRVFHARWASEQSKRLATLVDEELRAMNRRHGLDDLNGRSVAARNYKILRATKCPAVLVECGFMTNEYEVSLLANAGHRWSIADAILKAMERYEG